MREPPQYKAEAMVSNKERVLTYYCKVNMFSELGDAVTKGSSYKPRKRNKQTYIGMGTPLIIARTYEPRGKGG